LATGEWGSQKYESIANEEAEDSSSEQIQFSRRHSGLVGTNALGYKPSFILTEYTHRIIC